MSRFLVLALVGGVVLIVTAAYEFFIQAGTCPKPTTVSIAALEGSVPWNRHLIVTGGRAMVDDAIVCYKRCNYGKVEGSEVYFIPIQDATLAGYRSLTPALVVRITEAQMNAIRNGKEFNFAAIQGVRMTHWDLENKAEELLAKRYGKAAVKRMVILEYEKAVTGITSDLGTLLLGAVCFVGVSVYNRLTNKSKSSKRSAPSYPGRG
jgi:hypothetical protein